MVGEGDRGSPAGEVSQDERVWFAPRPASVPAYPPAGGGPPAATSAPQVPSLRRARVDGVVWRTRARTVRREALQAAALEIDRGAGFLLVQVFLCVGAIGYFATDAEPGWAQLVAVAAALAGAAWLARGSPIARALLLALLLVAVGAGAAKVETWRAATKVLGGEITTRLTGRVETVELRDSGRIRLTLAVLATDRPKLRYQPDRVRVTARAVPQGLVPGSVVVGVARLMPPLGPLRPDGYDFAFESFFDRIGANGFFLTDPELRPAAGPAPLADRAAGWVEAQRLALADHIRGRIGGPEGEIAAALVAGVRAGIPEEVNETLRITGLAHVLSISGLHMALVAGVVIGSLRLGFAAFPGFASRHPVRKYAAVGALAALAAYLLVSGSQVAAERSFLMIAVMLVALLVDRAALTMRNLAIAALAIVLVSPHEVVGPSFQMSFAATAALIAAYGWWAARREQHPAARPEFRGRTAQAVRTVALYAAGLAATSLIAGAATGIFGAWHFQRVSPLGLAANLAAMPVFSVVVMPAAVAGMALMPFGLDGWAFDAMGWGLSVALSVAGWLAQRTPFDAVGAIPLHAVILLAAALVPLTLATTGMARVVAVPLLVAGAGAILLRDLPDGFVTEDARLLGLRTPAGLLAVNRDRPNAFSVEDWSRALMVSGAARPGTGRAADLSPGDIPQDRFACSGDLCLIRHATGTILAHARTMPAAAPACEIAGLIVIADPTAANPCPHAAAKVVTARQLALHGSLEIRVGGAGQVAVRHAIGEGSRPWHDHRRFSRAARGMAPYAPTKMKAGDVPAP